MRIEQLTKSILPDQQRGLTYLQPEIECNHYRHIGLLSNLPTIKVLRNFSHWCNRKQGTLHLLLCSTPLTDFEIFHLPLYPKYVDGPMI